MSLDPEDVEAIVRRVAELLHSANSTTQLVTAEEVARRTGMSLQWVYRNATALRARRFGRCLRFDLKEVESIVFAAESRGHGRVSAERSARHTKAAALPPGVPLLKGRSVR